MKYTTSTFENNDQSIPSIINFRRIWYRCLRYWYLILLSLFIALTIAFLINRYSTRVYTLRASIIIKENQEAGQTAELLYNNPLVNSYRNFLNEPYIIRSYPLLQQVIDSLGYAVIFKKQGNIKTTEIDNLPFLVSGNKTGNNYLVAKYILKLTSSEKFSLVDISQDGEDENLKVVNGEFNIPIKLKGYNITFKAIDSTNDIIGEEYFLDFKDGLDVAKSYSSKLSVEWAEEGASVVNLKLNGELPNKEIAFLKKLIELYTLRDLNQKREAASNSKQFIDQQLAYISDSLKKIETQLQLFKDENTVVDIDVEAQRILSKITILEKSKSEYIVRKNYFNYLEDYLEKPDQKQQVILPSSIGVSDPVLVSLVSKLVDLQFKINSYEGSLNTNENPVAVNFSKEISNVKGSILESVSNLKSLDKIALNQLNEELREQEKQLSSLPSIERKYVTIKRNYNLGENLFVFLTQKRTEAAISEAATTSDIVTINAPGRSGGAIVPKVKLNYSVAILLGIVIPIMLFIILEISNNKIQSKEDIEMASKLPVIGVVGHSLDSQSMVVSNKPRSGIAEAFRSMRSNLNYFVKKDKFSLMVTSSISGEGKTFTVLNLSNVIAISGKKTIVVGADMRRPRISRELGLDNSFGLSNLLSDSNDLERAIQQTYIDNLYLLSSGPIPPNPGELLLRDNFFEILSLLKEKFDIVIIDTPPIGIVADALEVAPFIDHTLFITRQNYTPKEALTSLQDQVDQGKFKNVSIVFNDIYKIGAGYGYGYSYGYGLRNKNGGYYYE